MEAGVDRTGGYGRLDSVAAGHAAPLRAGPGGAVGLAPAGREATDRRASAAVTSAGRRGSDSEVLDGTQPNRLGVARCPWRVDGSSGGWTTIGP